MIRCQNWVVCNELAFVAESVYAAANLWSTAEVVLFAVNLGFAAEVVLSAMKLWYAVEIEVSAVKQLLLPNCAAYSEKKFAVKLCNL